VAAGQELRGRESVAQTATKLKILAVRCREGFLEMGHLIAMVSAQLLQLGGQRPNCTGGFGRH
jgi:hypothetical protein